MVISDFKNSFTDRLRSMCAIDWWKNFSNRIPPPICSNFISICSRFFGTCLFVLLVMTSGSTVEGRGFDPRREHFYQSEHEIAANWWWWYPIWKILSPIDPAACERSIGERIFQIGYHHHQFVAISSKFVCKSVPAGGRTNDLLHANKMWTKKYILPYNSLKIKICDLHFWRVSCM